MAYPLPSGWGEDRQGPVPSYSAYYVLTALKGGARAGAMLIAGQDQCFESITAAPTGWRFWPFTIDSRAVEVETGSTFRF